MSNKMKRVILYIATSADGFIADKNGGVDWLPSASNNNEHDEFGYQALLDRIDTIIMGSKSYDQILTFGDWAWTDKTSYVLTTRTFTPQTHAYFYNKSPGELIATLNKAKNEKDIWLLGGAEIIKTFASENLIDECIITEVPTVLHDGIKLDLPYNNFISNGVKQCSNGIIQRFYTNHSI